MSRRFASRLAIGLFATLVLGCKPGVDRTPLAPSAVDSIAAPAAAVVASPASTVVSWACATGHADSGSVSVKGWTFVGETCASSSGRIGAMGHGLVNAASHDIAPPSNLRAWVNGTTVQLTWVSIPGNALRFQIEVGSAPGLSDITSFQTAQLFSPVSVTFTGVPPGVYFIRVRLSEFFPFTASNEIVVTVDDSCGGPLRPPSGLQASVTGDNVGLFWTAPPGVPATAYVLEVGSAPGGSDVLVYDTRSASTALQGVAPTGLYYVRVRAKNRCGTSGASNERVVAVGMLPAPPVAAFSAVCHYERCDFFASRSSGTALTFFWEFGDGTTGTGGPYVLHQYPRPTTPTTYTVRLTVTDAFGRTSTATHDVTAKLTY